MYTETNSTERSLFELKFKLMCYWQLRRLAMHKKININLMSYTESFDINVESSKSNLGNKNTQVNKVDFKCK